jgi:NAD(P)-dependent dehydrogenase (short-subunit alcohol dehydrogenase family)
MRKPRLTPWCATSSHPAEEPLPCKQNVGREEDILRLFAVADREFGTLTGLVNNAGTEAPHRCDHV